MAEHNTTKTTRPRQSSDPDWKPRFLDALSSKPGGKRLTIGEACRRAGVSRQRVYDARDKDPEFALALKFAIEEYGEDLEIAAWDRAVVGIDEPVIYQGQLMGTWRMPDGSIVAPNTPGATLTPLTVKKYSDSLLALMLKANHPRYRDVHRQDLEGAEGEPVRLILQTAKVDPDKL